MDLDALQAQFAPIFLARLGNGEQELLYRRALELAIEQGLADIAQQAEAWLTFSIQTSVFEYNMIKAEERMKVRGR